MSKSDSGSKPAKAPVTKLESKKTSHKGSRRTIRRGAASAKRASRSSSAPGGARHNVSPGEESADSRNHDVILPHSRTKDGQGIRALRARDGRVELSELRPLQAGKPLTSNEIVRLHPRQQTPVYDVEVLYSNTADEQGGSADSAEREASSSTADEAVGTAAGPPRVTSDAYRRNWERIFGSPRRGRRNWSASSGGAEDKPN